MTIPQNNVICMKWGDKYSADYVNILFNMVSRNLSIPFRFACFTDDPKGINEQVEVFNLPSLNLPNNIPEIIKIGDPNPSSATHMTANMKK